MKSIETALFPLLFVLCVCGLGVFEYPKGRPRLYFTILYVLTILLIHSYIVIQSVLFVNKNNIEFPWIIIVFLAVILTIIPLNIYFYKRFKCCLKKLDIVNDTLERFGTLKNYSRLRAQIIWVIIGWLFFIFLTDSANSLWLSVLIPNSRVTHIPYMIDYSINIRLLYELTFIILLRYIGHLYDQVNENIQKLIVLKKRQVMLAHTISASSSLTYRRPTDTTKFNQLFYILMHTHFELSSILREFNTIFGLQMVIQVASLHLCGVNFFIECYKMLVLDRTHLSGIAVTCIVSWATRCLLDIIAINHTCEVVCMKANQTEIFLNRLANIAIDAETQENITQFLLEILRKPLRISGCGLFDFGYKLVQKYTIRALQIIVIVIQARK